MEGLKFDTVGKEANYKLPLGVEERGRRN